MLSSRFIRATSTIRAGTVPFSSVADAVEAARSVVGGGKRMTEETKVLAEALLAGDRSALARSITLVESTRIDHREQAEMLLDVVLESRSNVTSHHKPSSNPSTLSPSIPDGFRIGLAGPPGAGKSTLIEKLGLYLCEQGHRPAILAIDPSSSRSGGSILGDKTRMNELSMRREAYVRPSPTSGRLGGVAEATNEAVLLCEAAGHDVVLVETVGLGQSEVVVDEAVDMTLLVTPPGGGDELQGVKRGIMEVVDAVVVTKADGELVNSARHAAADLRRALQLVPRKHKGWKPPVLLTSALNPSPSNPTPPSPKQSPRSRRNAQIASIADLWTACLDFHTFLSSNPDPTSQHSKPLSRLLARRAQQGEAWMWSALESELLRLARHDEVVRKEAATCAPKLAKGEMSPRRAGRVLFQLFTHSKGIGQ